MLNKAEKAGLKLIPVLFDFLAFEEVPKENSLPMQGFHGALFWDDNNITAFLENALVPMLTRCPPPPTQKKNGGKKKQKTKKEKTFNP